MAETVARLGVIGGTGLYQMADLADIEERQIETPFGPPSDPITIGTLGGERVAFLARHGRGHRYSPTRVPYRANLWALKSLGVERVIAVSAVGSMREELAPLDLVVPDQLFDRTTDRPRTFFDAEAGGVAHVSLADPFCPATSAALLARLRRRRSARRSIMAAHISALRGPNSRRAASRASSARWGMDIIGMTGMPEARLAREAGLCYAMLALVTDYDVWHDEEEPVTVQMVVERLHRNAVAAQTTVAGPHPAPCHDRRLLLPHGLAIRDRHRPCRDSCCRT